jgi:hypothetical protein
MTNEEINRAIAESVGWGLVPLDGREFAGIPVMVWKRPDGERGFPISDYCNDLNAMHEVENRLTDDEHLRFRNTLWLLIIRTTQFPHHVSRNVHSATARQRAEAYLRTIGKWKDA